jgi:hypothetical protein
MARTRLIRPEFFDDETLASVPIPTRFFYIGLWTLCDDAGYFDWKPNQIAANLFPYEPRRFREKLADEALTALVGVERIVQLDCGKHGIIPTLVKHGIRGGNRSDTQKRAHFTTCAYKVVQGGIGIGIGIGIDDSNRALTREGSGGGLKATLGEYSDVIGKKH